MQYHKGSHTVRCQFLYCRKTVQINQVNVGYEKTFFACILNYFSSLILLQNLFLTLMKETFYEFLNLPKHSRDFFVLVALLEIQ